MKITSTMELGPALPKFSQDEIKNEPMLFNCSADAAWELGGPITRAFLESLGSHQAVVIDTRSHMLMQGWWPCIPGWHHDDVPRSRSDGQPNYETPEYHSMHAMALINGDMCPTQFAVGVCELPEVPLGRLSTRNGTRWLSGCVTTARCVGRMRLASALSGSIGNRFIRACRQKPAAGVGSAAPASSPNASRPTKSGDRSRSIWNFRWRVGDYARRHHHPPRRPRRGAGGDREVEAPSIFGGSVGPIAS